MDLTDATRPAVFEVVVAEAEISGRHLLVGEFLMRLRWWGIGQAGEDGMGRQHEGAV